MKTGDLATLIEGIVERGAALQDLSELRDALLEIPARLRSMEKALETIEIVADNEAMDATDTHYAIILSGIKATARDARALSGEQQ